MRRLKSLTQTCDSCPSQWAGELTDGTPVYIRYRWGVLRVDLNPWTGQAETILHHQLGDGLDGWLEEHAMLTAISAVIDSSAGYTPWQVTD